MHLREGEQVVKVFHHHPTPFVFDIFKVIAVTAPIFVILLLFREVLPSKWYLFAHIIIFMIFGLIIIYVSILFWMDKLVVTNYRVVHVNWKYLTVHDEAEVELEEISDIQTHEKGFLANFWIFDYGTFILATSSSEIAIKFFDAPNPEGIRRMVYHIKHQ